LSQQDCEKCQSLFEPLAYQELLASLRIAQYVKSLETIGWETWCDYSNRTASGSQRRPMDDQLEGTLEGEHVVVRVSKTTLPVEDLDSGSQGLDVEDDTGSSQTSDGSSTSRSSSTMDSESSQVSIPPYIAGDKGERPRNPRAGFRLDMKVIREAQRVRIQRLDPDLINH
jgi:hypothetical protein